MKDKKNVVIAVLAVLAIVFGILFISSGSDKFTQAQVDERVAKAKEGLTEKISKLEADAQTAAEESTKALADAKEEAEAALNEAVAAAKEEAEAAQATAVEEAVAAAKEGLFDQAAVDEQIAAAKEGLFDQAAVDEQIAAAVAAAKEGLFDQAAVDEQIAAAVDAAKEGLFDQAAIDEQIAAALETAKTEAEGKMAEAVEAAKEGLLDQTAVEEKIQEAVAAAKEGLLDQTAVDEKIQEAVAAAKEGLFDQAAVEEKIQEATKDLFNAEQLQEKVEEAKEELNKTITELEEKVKTLEEQIAKPAEEEKKDEAETPAAEEEKKDDGETIPDEGEAQLPVLTHEAYDAAELESEVCVETYVQATQAWWDNKITVYGQSPDGAYFIYNMDCSQEDAAKLVPGTKIRVRGFKSAWSGEVEITDSAFEIIEGDTFIAEPEDVTAKLGTDDLIKCQNELVAFKGMTVEAYDETGAAFAYKNAENKTDDLYFKVSKDGQTYDFCVEFYLCDNTTDVYKAVEALNVGDVIDMEGFLYWYNGANPHITKVTKAE